MELDTGRRRFLELAGTGTALSLAGCSALQENTESQETTETTPAGESGGQEVVTAAVQADQKKLQQRQQEVRSEFESGNISRTEAQKQIQTAEQELRSNAISSFRQRVSSSSGLSIDGTVEQFGILQVSGSSSALIDALSFAEVNALLPEDVFQQAKAQAQAQQTGTGTATGTSSD
jgi:hypothetical protein